VFVRAAVGTLPCFAWCVLHFVHLLFSPDHVVLTQILSSMLTCLSLYIPLLLSFVHLLLSEAPFNNPVAVSLLDLQPVHGAKGNWHAQ